MTANIGRVRVDCVIGVNGAPDSVQTDAWGRTTRLAPIEITVSTSPTDSDVYVTIVGAQRRADGSPSQRSCQISHSWSRAAWRDEDTLADIPDWARTVIRQAGFGDLIQKATS